MERLFSDCNKKIIIGNSLQEVDLLIKNSVIKHNKPISNYEKFTIGSLASFIIQGYKKYENYQILDSDESKALFYSFLGSHIKSGFIFNLIPKESFSFTTVCNAYDSINQIRNGKIKKDDKNLSDIIVNFENYLVSKKMLDESLVLKKTNELLVRDKNKIIEKIGNCKNVSFYLLPSLKNRLSYQEYIFVKGLLDNQVIDDNYLSYDSGENLLKTKIPTYGYSNEIKYIIKTINEKEYNLGDVAVYTSSKAYDGMIKAFFDNAKINYLFTYGEDLSCEDYFTFFNSVLEFLRNHFNIEHLYSLYRNPAIGYYEDNDGKSHSYSYISRIKYLRADREQIINEVGKWDSEERRDFVKELVCLYNEDDSIVKIYKKVLEFTNKYTTTLSHRYVKDVLLQKERLFLMFDDINIDYYGKIEMIQSILSSIKITKTMMNQDSSYITINPISSTLLNRKYNFFIGLSANEMTQNEIESPLISDEQYNDMLDCNYYVKLGKKRNEEYNIDLNNLIKTQNEGEQYYITSEYDSVEFKPLAKSTFYLSIPIKEEKVFYSIDDITINDCDQLDDYLFPQTTENIGKSNNLNLSPSAIGDIINCPIKHIYKLIYEDIQLDNYSDNWLKGGEEGTFAHAVLEKYFDNIIVNGLVNNGLDNNVFEQSYSDVYRDTKNEHSFSNVNIQDIEAQKIKVMVKNYLDRYYSSNSLYRPIECELEINKDVNNCIYNANGIIYQIHGKIDRIDAYVDENRNLHLRIIDYKTEKEKFDLKNNPEKLSQVILYPYLINDYINKNTETIEKKVGKFDIRQQYDIEFVYEFLKLEISESYKSQYDAIKEVLDKALIDYNRLIQKPTWNILVEIYQPKIIKKDNNNEGRCNFCSYTKYCKLKMQKGDNKVWSK